jgi:Zn-dependent protease
VKTYYRLNASRVTFREYAFSSPWPVVIPIAGIIKLFRIPISGSSDDPPVENLTPFEVPEAELPDEVRERFAPLAGELAELGFGRPIFHQIRSPLQYTHIYWATFAHPTGRAAARIHHRIWSQQTIHKSYLFPVFISELSDGSFLVSSAGKRDLAAPKSVEDHYSPGASAAELWREHERRLDERLPAGPVDVRSEDRVRQMVERLHATLRDFHVGRGVFRPVSAAEQDKLAEQEKLAAENAIKQATAPASAAEGATRPGAVPATVEDAVLARLERQRMQKTSWQNFLGLLVVSLVAFLAAGLKDMKQEFLLMLVPILLFHELGHYIAMRCFGYRNLRMFFIPFIGAAVAGKHYNIAGWKKALVALAGPVPGIFVGVVLGVFGTVLKQPKLTDASALMLILNGLNLLPFLPLDGGWVVHMVLFCRHPLLDMAFRVVAIVAFFGLSLLFHGYLWVIGLGLLLGLPAAWHAATVAQRLRDRGAIVVSPDDVSIPRDAVRTILTELGAGKYATKPANLLAQQVTSIFETLNARPPGVGGSLGLLAAQGGSFFTAFVFVVVFMVLRHGLPLPDRFPARNNSLPYSFTPGNTGQRAGDGAALLNAAAPAAKAPENPPPGPVTFAASYEDEATAKTRFGELLALDRNPGPGHGAFLGLLGQTVLITLPPSDAPGRDRWKGLLDPTTKTVAVGDKDNLLILNFSCTLPDEREAEPLLQELQGYFHFARSDDVLAPWSPARAALPPPQRQSSDKALHTLGRLMSLERRARQDPEVAAIGREMVQSMQSRDRQGWREVSERHRKAAQAVRERLLADIVADKVEADQKMVELWQRRSKVVEAAGKALREKDRTARETKHLECTRQLDALDSEMARRVGHRTLAADSPETKVNLTGCAGPAAMLPHDSTVSISGLQFHCPAVGLPVFGEWLAGHGARDIRYDCKTYPRDRWEGLDDD